MSELTVQSAAITGLYATYANASSGGDKFLNDGNTLLHAKNASGGDITVTINSVEACDQGFDHDIAVVVSAGKDWFIGPFTKRFNDTDNCVNVTYSGVSSLTVAAIRIP